MYAVFSVNEEHTVVLRPEAAKLCKYLKKVTEDQLIYIILAHDYAFSPYRLKPPQERKNLALSRVFPKLKEEPVELLDAVEEYKGLIYDHNIASKDRFLQKKVILEKALIGETEARKIKEIMETIELIDSKIDKVVEKIHQAELEFELKGGGDLSLIEKWIMNRESYQQVQGSIVLILNLFNDAGFD